jgi:hypothetical protein
MFATCYKPSDRASPYVESDGSTAILVFDNYDLMPSETAVIPRWPGWERLRRLVEEHPGATYGWYAHPPANLATDHDEEL